jgi:hypothetical protein
MIRIVRGGITAREMDAIVNAANQGPVKHVAQMACGRSTARREVFKLQGILPWRPGVGL